MLRPRVWVVLGKIEWECEQLLSRRFPNFAHLLCTPMAE
jgi:hypothetical protein